MTLPEGPVVVVEVPVIEVVEVVEGSQVAVIETSTTEVVEMGIAGPQGPRGLPGSGGGDVPVLESPQDEQFIVANLGAGGSQQFDAGAITVGKVGKLFAVDAGASVPLRVDAEVVNGSRVWRTSFRTEAGESEPWRTPHPDFITVDGDGTAHFGVTVLNLDPVKQSDVRVTIFWDEVTP